MTMQDVRTLLEIYGADPARWPEEHRQEMTDAIASSKELQTLARDEAALDAELALWSAPAAADEGGIDRLMQSLPSRSYRLVRPAAWLGGGFAIAASVAAAILALSPSPAPQPVVTADDEEAVWSMVFSEPLYEEDYIL